MGSISDWIYDISVRVTWCRGLRVSPGEEDELAVGVQGLVELDGVVVPQHEVPHVPRLDLAEGLGPLVGLAAAVRGGPALRPPVEVPVSVGVGALEFKI